MQLNVNEGYFKLFPFPQAEYYDNKFSCDFECIKGKVITAVLYEKERLHIHLNSHVLVMYHQQDCCESVELEDVVGDFQRMIGQEILEASLTTDQQDMDGESVTYSYYNIRTIKESIQLRWVGSSNGYYSETVDTYLISVSK